MYGNDTIVAAATPKGAGALAILRVSGINAFKLFESIINEKEKFLKSSPFSQKLYTIISAKTGEVLDEVTVIKFISPKSFTGEDMIEITCHGGSIIVERVIEAIIVAGARYASRGEFTRRAFLNGKVDLKKAESINRIIHAESIISHRNAVKHYLGEDRHFFDGLKDELQQLLVAIETEIEFSETDDIGVEDLFTTKISDLLNRVKSEFASEINKREKLKKIDAGVTVSLIGRANAGKSSILNMILGYDRAIINSRAGTTRDLITESLSINDIRVRFVDTAGLNETEDDIELEGIKRTKSIMAESEILCWIIAADEPFPVDDFNLLPKDKQNVIAIINKSDITDNSNCLQFCTDNKIKMIKLSAITEDGKNEFIKEIERNISENFSDMEFETVIGSDREEGIIRRLLSDAEDINLNYPLEILSESIKDLLRYFDEIYGKSSPDDILNRVFSDFCIGK